MRKLMKQIKAVDIEASEVIIKTSEHDIVIKNPQVVKTNMAGVTSFQISGEISESIKYSEEDIEIIQEKTGCTKIEAEQALGESQGDIAEAILSLKE